MNRKIPFLLSLVGLTLFVGAACKTAENTNSPVETATNWQTYTSDYGFEVQYPEDWKVRLEIDSKEVTYMEDPALTDPVFKVSFGTVTRAESSEGASDGEWFVSVYDGDMPAKSIDGLITGTGTYYSDRQEKREDIIINGIPAIKATITTPSDPSWVYEAVLIEQDDRVFFLSNGAIKNDSFDEFYNSFKRIGSAGMLEVLMEQVEGDVFSLQDTIQIGLRTTGIFAKAQTGVSHELFLVNEDGTFVGLIGKIEAGQTSYDWQPDTLKHYGGLDYSEAAPVAGAYRVVYVVWRPEIYRTDIAADVPDQDLTSGKTTFVDGKIQHYGGEDENEVDPTDVLAAEDAGLFYLE